MIVCIGDSITFGQHLSPEQAWPSLIVGREIVAAGVPSDTTRLGLERFPRDVQERSPQAVVIQFGHNDCNRWDTGRGLPRVSSRAYEANLIEMIDRCYAFGALPFLCTLTPSLRNERHGNDVAAYDHLLRGVAEFYHATLIDVREAFESVGAAYLLLPDGLHLNEHGHRLYAATVTEALDNVLR